MVSFNLLSTFGWAVRFGWFGSMGLVLFGLSCMINQAKSVDRYW